MLHRSTSAAGGRSGWTGSSSAPVSSARPCSAAAAARIRRWRRRPAPTSTCAEHLAKALAGRRPGRLSSGLRRPTQDHGMKTRDRILECALQLFNERGEPNVSTLEIATELGISPGNLYYHFHGKEPLILGLFERFQAELAPLLAPPEDVQLDVEDYWLFLHLIVERLAHYRFLFQDLSNLASRVPKLERGIR